MLNKWIPHLKPSPSEYTHSDSRGLSLLQARLIQSTQKKARQHSLIVALSLLAFLTWAAIANVPQSAHGLARVVPSKRLQVVQAVDGGVITDVFVKEGARVTESEVLIQIDTTRFDSSLNEKVAVEAALSLREARLKALLNGTGLKVDEDFRNRHPELYRQEVSLLESKRGEWRAQGRVYEEQLTQKQREYDEAVSRARAAQTSLSLLQRELDQLRPMLSSGAVSSIEVFRIEKQVAQAQGDYSASVAQSRRLESGISEARSKLNELQLKNENEVRSELSEVKGKLASLSQNKVELSDRVAQATIKSPVKGQIQRILYNTRGAVVPPGEPVIEIIPEDDLLVFETRIRPQDIGFLKAGQKAQVKVSAYDYAIYGALQGQVDSISADSLLDEKSEAYYSVKITVGRDGIPADVQLIPGMTADVSIETDERTVLSYLLRPLSRGFSKAFTER